MCEGTERIEGVEGEGRGQIGGPGTRDGKNLEG